MLRLMRSKKIAAALVAGISLMAINATSASADPWHGNGHGWHGNGHGGWGGGPVVVVRPGFYRPPPPVYYAPPPAYYAPPPPAYYAPPPPVYYAPPPPPAYYVPAPALEFRFRL
jgi:hypothetical protein